MKLGVLLLSLLLIPSTQAPPQDDAKKDLEKFQGNWLIQTMNGQSVPPEAEAYLVFKGDKYEQWNGNDVSERGSFTVDGKAKPMTIDLIITEGGDAGNTQLGLVEFNGDVMSVGFAAPGVRTRPATFDQAELYATLKKAK
jgi:uncharacterized protein (TIGR03067 family)